MKKVYPADVAKRKDEVVIDVREPDEVAEGKILGSIHIPLGDLEHHVNEFDKNKSYIMVCRSGGRSGKATEYLESKGFEVSNMEGGMLAWTDKTESKRGSNDGENPA